MITYCCQCVMSIMPDCVVTLLIILTQIINYYYPYWPIEDVCIEVNRITKNHEWKRLFLATFYHLNIIHLVLNVDSLYTVGRDLENELGGLTFSWIFIFTTFSSNIILVTFLYILGIKWPIYSQQCVVGSSGVIFSLHTFCCYFWPFCEVENVRVHRFSVILTMLICIHLIFWNSSFLGHISGILAGGICCLLMLAREHLSV
ncbi:rhomboid-related protein 4-like [Centruroides sculpturatus]|uniref:rhomboid-related protein 4-like n=1 Tax=Centruroides sculpturatus TaxID=218467 RepID=UPI000C6CFF01|nr:rhomboid-related protein 4-like [Centruroides sculpturatus]XP_023242520.1 rhomboid-related protein 4-like [Centruroides sculpturatus]